MPTYELVLLLKQLPRPELKDAIKRSARCIFSAGGVLRKMENLGFAKLPYRIHGITEANRFVYTFDLGDKKVAELREALSRDVSVIRQRVFFVEDKTDIKLEEESPECDVYIDQLPVPERPHVRKMVEISKKKAKAPFCYGVGRTSDPIGR